jgi:hypothetical protein
MSLGNEVGDDIRVLDEEPLQLSNAGIAVDAARRIRLGVASRGRAIVRHGRVGRGRDRAGMTGHGRGQSGPILLARGADRVEGGAQAGDEIGQ